MNKLWGTNLQAPVREKMSEKTCSCRNCFYHRAPLCTGVLSLLGLATLILSPIWIMPQLPENLTIHLGQEEPSGVARFLPTVELVMLCMLASMIAFLGYKIYTLSKDLHSPQVSAAAEGSGRPPYINYSSEAGDADSFTGSRKADIRLAWGLMGVSSVFFVGLMVSQFGRKSQASSPGGTLGNMLPGLVGSYILYQMLRRNNFSLYNVLAEIVNTIRAVEKRSRQPVRTLFSPDDETSNNMRRLSSHGDH